MVCVYRLDNSDGADIYSSDFHDDGEAGAGRHVLQLMERHNITCKAVFIARRYGGIRMGASRFTCYQRAAMSCLGITQDIENHNIVKGDVNQTRNPPSQYRRGGYGGRGRGAAANWGGRKSSQSYRGRRRETVSSQPFSINFTNADAEYQQQATPYIQQHQPTTVVLALGS